MKKLVVLATIVVAALSLAGAAQAGCWATVGISPLVDDGYAVGKPWVVTVRVMQHGMTPMRDARPEVRVRSVKTGLIVFKAKPTAKVGSYRASVVFPKAGRYSIRVYDGFPVKECAKVTAFGSVVVADV
jgi:hypothetical protein